MNQFVVVVIVRFEGHRTDECTIKTFGPFDEKTARAMQDSAYDEVAETSAFDGLGLFDEYDNVQVEVHELVPTPNLREAVKTAFSII